MAMSSNPNGPLTPDDQKLPAEQPASRQSGAQEWINARGEGGAAPRRQPPLPPRDPSRGH